MTNGVMSKLISDLIGVIYPAYFTHKAIHSGKSVDQNKWMKYWVIYSIIYVVDMLLLICFVPESWIVAYYELKSLVLGIMFMPLMIKRNILVYGSSVIYEYLNFNLRNRPDENTTILGESMTLFDMWAVESIQTGDEMWKNGHTSPGTSNHFGLLWDFGAFGLQYSTRNIDQDPLENVSTDSERCSTIVFSSDEESSEDVANMFDSSIDYSEIDTDGWSDSSEQMTFPSQYIETNTVTYRYKGEKKISSSPNKKMDEECAICLTEFVENEEVRRLPCMHIFHRKCDKWLKDTGKCALCRMYLHGS